MTWSGVVWCKNSDPEQKTYTLIEAAVDGYRWRTMEEELVVEPEGMVVFFSAAKRRSDAKGRTGEGVVQKTRSVRTNTRLPLMDFSQSIDRLTGGLWDFDPAQQHSTNGWKAKTGDPTSADKN